MALKPGTIANDGAIPTTSMNIPMPAGTKPPPPAPVRQPATSKK